MVSEGVRADADRLADEIIVEFGIGCEKCVCCLELLSEIRVVRTAHVVPEAFDDSCTVCFAVDPVADGVCRDVVRWHIPGSWSEGGLSDLVASFDQKPANEIAPDADSVRGQKPVNLRQWRGDVGREVESVNEQHGLAFSRDELLVAIRRVRTFSLDAYPDHGIGAFLGVVFDVSGFPDTCNIIPPHMPNAYDDSRGSIFAQ